MPTRRELLQLSATAAALAAAGGSGCIGWTRQEAVAVDSWNKSVCRFCGTGCETDVGIAGGRVVAVRGLQEGWNRGRLCIKGLANRDILYVSDRALHPMVRRNGRLERATWDEALDAAAAGFRAAIERSGPGAVGFYGSGQLYTQESYTANKLFKAGLRTNNVDGNPRLCMASAAVAYTTVFGADEPMGCYEDFDHATYFFVIGANPAECHPVLWERILDRKRTHPATRIVVVDPRRTPSTRHADLHLQHRPGTDVALLNAMTWELIRSGMVDREFVDAHTRFQAPDGSPLDWDGYRSFLEDYAPERVANLCGLSAAEIREAARLFGTAEAALSIWTMGLNQQTHGVAANRGVMSIHLITGQLGRPGTGAFSLTGQPNAGGGVRDAGVLSHTLPAGRLVRNPEHRAQVEQAWGVPPGTIAPEPGYHAVAMFEAMVRGDLEACLVMCTNPARSLPNADKYRRGMEQTFLVVADSVFPSDTALLADVFFPAAMWAEKTGVFSQSERRYHLVEKLVEPPGEARSDLEILLAFADRLGLGELFPNRTPESIWNEWREMSRGTYYDFSGITWERLQTTPGIIWPCPSPDHPGTCRRFVPGEDPLARRAGRVDFYARPDGRAVIFATPQGPFAEPPRTERPFILSTGRRLELWHTNTLTGQIPHLAEIPVDYLEIHPTDAWLLRVQDGQQVRVASDRGSVELRAVFSNRVRPGVVFATFHSRERLVNATTIDSVDPLSSEPEYKLAAVSVEPLPEAHP